jgi:hypothetical protein
VSARKTFRVHSCPWTARSCRLTKQYKRRRAARSVGLRTESVQTLPCIHRLKGRSFRWGQRLSLYSPFRAPATTRVFHRPERRKSSLTLRA